MTLYGVRGWGSVLVEAMLAVAGTNYEFIDVDGFDKPGAARDVLLAVNPLAQVPTLRLDDGTVMTESAAIALVLAERVPAAPLVPPPGSPDRPRFLRLLVWMVANVYPTFTYGDYPERWSADEAGLRQATDAYREQLWRWFETEAGAPYVLGDRMSALDIYVAAMVHWRPRRDWFDAEAPRLAAIADAVMQNPAIGQVFARNFPQPA